MPPHYWPSLPLGPQYGPCRSQSLGRPCAGLCAGWITCADAVATFARNGGVRRSLLQDCYMDVGDTRTRPSDQWAVWDGLELPGRAVVLVCGGLTLTGDLPHSVRTDAFSDA